MMARTTGIQSRPVLGREFLPVAVAAILLGAIWLSSDYAWSYVWFALMCVTMCARVTRYARPLFILLSGYLLIALLNISSWRGYVDLYTLQMYGAALFALFLPLSIVNRRRRFTVARLRAVPLVRLMLVLQLGIAFAVVLFLYATKGLIILKQDLRFGIPPSLEYVVKSPLPLAVFVPFLARTTRNQLLVVAALIAPTILIGSRGSAIVALLSYAICRAYSERSQVKRRPVSRRTLIITVAAASAVLISLGFFVRRSAGTQLIAASEVARRYFDSDAWWVYAIMPFHLGFRETVGLSNRIVTGEMRNEVNDHALFVADLYTVLPGEQLAAGQSLGQVFGAIESGGLTPGLLGGLYIDFGPLAVVGFFVIGALLAWSIRRAFKRQRAVPIYVVLLVQVVHLFHRGFLKPEYLTSVVTALVYVSLMRTSGRRVQPSQLWTPKGPDAPDTARFVKPLEAP